MSSLVGFVTHPLRRVAFSCPWERRKERKLKTIISFFILALVFFQLQCKDLCLCCLKCNIRSLVKVNCARKYQLSDFQLSSLVKPQWPREGKNSGMFVEDIAQIIYKQHPPPSWVHWFPAPWSPSYIWKILNTRYMGFKGNERIIMSSLTSILENYLIQDMQLNTSVQWQCRLACYVWSQYRCQTGELSHLVWLNTWRHDGIPITHIWHICSNRVHLHV